MAFGLPAAEATDEARDKSQVKRVVKQIESNPGDRPKELSADCGYFSEASVRLLEDRVTEVLIPPTRKRHTIKSTSIARSAAGG